MHYGSNRNPMYFRRPEVDPYQQAFLQNTSSLKEHKDVKGNVRAALFFSLTHLTFCLISLFSFTLPSPPLAFPPSLPSS